MSSLYCPYGGLQGAVDQLCVFPGAGRTEATLREKPLIEAFATLITGQGPLSGQPGLAAG